jgi:hypothetical protein
MRLPCRLSMHNLSLVELTRCYILTTERTGGGQEKVMRLPCRLSMHYLSLVELTGCYILTTERAGGGQEKVMRLPCRLSMHYLSLVELTGCFILTTERAGGGQEKVMRLLAEAMPAVHTQKEARERTGQYSLTSVERKYEPRCAAHVCTLFSSTANLRESYGSQVYQGMQSSREEMWVGPSVTAR